MAKHKHSEPGEPLDVWAAKVTAALTPAELELSIRLYRAIGR